MWEMGFGLFFWCLGFDQNGVEWGGCLLYEYCAAERECTPDFVDIEVDDGDEDM